MYEFHGWFALSESNSEDSESDALMFKGKVALVEFLAALDWAAEMSDVVTLNSASYLRLHGICDSPGRRLVEVDAILELICARLPGSYGLLYERFDRPDLALPVGRDHFRVRVMARGVVQERLDPFLSPIHSCADDRSGALAVERYAKKAGGDV